jgi:ribosomal protein L16 Arg81 hydroxylase
MRSLADLLSGAGEEFFFQHFLTKERFLLPSGSRERAESLLPWAEIDRLFSAQPPSDKHFRVMLNANRLEGRLYRDPESGVVRTEALQALASQGATFVLGNIHAQIPRIDALMAAIGRRVQCYVWANCYISFGSSSGFLTHFDDHDVLILQVWGAKRWRTYGTPFPHPIDGKHLPEPNPPVWEGVTHSGDVLYIPRGEIHAAVPEERPSVHLTIGILPKRGMDFLGWFGKHAERVERLRMDLERHGDAMRVSTDGAEAKRAALALLDDTAIADYLSDDDSKTAPRRLAAFNIRGRLEPGSILLSALRRRLDLQIGTDEELEIEIGGKLVRLSAMARQALHLITERDWVSLTTLAASLGRETDDAQLLDSLDELTRKALIAIEA